MSYSGTVKNGVIVLERSARLKDGTRVRVHAIPEQSHAPRKKSATTKAKRKPAPEKLSSMAKMLLKYAGKVKGLPADFAEQHDHYLYGTPKR